MKKENIKRYCGVWVLLFFSACLQPALAQQPSVKTFTDKQDILIGAQIKYTVIARFNKEAFRVNWFTIPDSTAHFEIVDKTEVDSSIENSTTILKQIITLTSFDSGRWKTPGFKINFTSLKPNDNIDQYTDSIWINVGYAPSDSTQQLRDIKPILEISETGYFWYYLLGGILAGLLVIYLVMKYSKKRKTNFSSQQTPYDEAIEALQKLKEYLPKTPEAVKFFHSELSFILKRYLSRSHGISLLSKTTGDTLIYLTQLKLPKEDIAALAGTLRMGDAVKFAKFMPLLSESESCFATINEMIQHVHNHKSIRDL